MPQRKKNRLFLVNLWALMGDKVEAWIRKHPPARQVTAAQVERLLEFVLFPDLLKYDSPTNRKMVGTPKGKDKKGVMRHDWRNVPKTKEDNRKQYARLQESFKRVHTIDADFAFGLAAHIRQVWSRLDLSWIVEKFLRLTGHVASPSGRQRKFINANVCHDSHVVSGVKELTGKSISIQTVKDAREKIFKLDYAFARIHGIDPDAEEEPGPRPGPSQSSYP